jgi:AcrR family transcriptional regulator
VTTPQRRTQRERTEESARRLAEAAIELIVEKGYINTTAREIGVRAGYSRAMVAERFGTKDALLDTILERDYERRIDVEPGPEATGFDRLLAPVDALIAFAKDDPRLLRAMFILNFEAVHDSGVLRQRIQQWLTGFRAKLAEGIRVGQVDGSVTPDVDPADASQEILAAGIGYAYLWIVTPNEFDMESALSRWRNRLATSLSARSGVHPASPE